MPENRTSINVDREIRAITSRMDQLVALLQQAIEERDQKITALEKMIAEKEKK